MSNPEPQDEPPKNELGSILTALQKSFSRVSRDAAKRPASDARALIVGKVTFDLSFKCDIAPDKHYLLVGPEGSMALRLTGTIEADIRDVVVERVMPPSTKPGHYIRLGRLWLLSELLQASLREQGG